MNLNTEIFPDVSEVGASIDYGVYPDVEKGHTSKYASLLDLERPSIKIVEETNSGIFRSKNAKNTVKYVQALHTNFMSNALEESSEDCEVVKQAGTGADHSYYYYGKVVDAEGKKFIMQPQVYFPIKKTNTSTLLCDGEMPDFVVLVTISFNSDGRTFVFTQRYLPKIVKIKRSEVPAMIAKLEKFKKTASKGYGKVTGSEISVCYPNGAETIQKTIDILNKIK